MGFMSSSVGVKALPPVLQRMLQDPVAISAIGSLALHLPLLVLLPRLFAGTPTIEDPEIKSAVDVVELTPAEQGRVAEFQTPEIILPPLSQTPSALSITPLPKPSNSFSEPSLPPLPNPSTGSFWGLGSSFQFPPIGNTSPPPTFTVPQTQTPYFIPSYTPPQIVVRPSPNLPQTAPSPAASPSPSPSPSATDNPVAAIDPVTEASPSPSPTARTDEQITRDLQASIQERRESLSYNATGTSQEEATSVLEQWVREAGTPWVGADQDVVGMAQQQGFKLNGTYPDAARVRQDVVLKGNVLVAILVDENGKPASEAAVTVIQSSGYRIFDKAAQQDALSYEFEPTGKKTVYFINVEYVPDRAA
jgi:outer membrane biosynthesis protein TonB